MWTHICFRFRWVDCQLDALARCSSVKALRNALESLPHTLDETYDRILLSIPEEHRGIAMIMLQWLTFSARPISLGEMAEIVSIDVDNITPDHRHDQDQRLRDPRDILEFCSALVTFSDYDTGKLSLAHLSVKEYLVSERIKRGPAPQYHINKSSASDLISQGCLAYLLQFDTFNWDQLTRDSLSLGQYSAEFWIIHARPDGGAIQECLQPLINTLFQPQSAQFFNWVRLKPSRTSTISVPDAPSPIYLASLLGLDFTTRYLLLSHGADDINIAGEHGTPLIVAAYLGHKEIVSMLLDHGADVDITRVNGANALITASERGHKDIVEALLDHGANVDVASTRGGSALVAASWQGHKDIVRFLLDHGAGVNLASAHGYSALIAAAKRGYTDIAEVLLDRGADVNLVQTYGASALVAASGEGHRNLVKILLDRGADVNLANARMDSALVTAVKKRCTDTVKVFLDYHREKPNIQSRTFSAALWSALHWNQKEIAEILLTNGAELSLLDGEAELIKAASAGRDEIVKVLLQQGANLGWVDWGHFSALTTATLYGHIKVITVLLEHASNTLVNARHYVATMLAALKGCRHLLRALLDHFSWLDQDRNTISSANTAGGSVQRKRMDYLVTQSKAAMIATLDRRHEEAMGILLDILLDQQSDVNWVDANGRTPLIDASAGGHRDVVRLLLDRGADVNMACGPLGSALIAASAEGHYDIVTILLKCGADINAVGEAHGTALIAAAKRGHGFLVRRLLSSGADVHLILGHDVGGTKVRAEGSILNWHRAVTEFLIGRRLDGRWEDGWFRIGMNAEEETTNLSIGWCGSALIAASMAGHHSIVATILELEAHISFRDETGRMV